MYLSYDISLHYRWCPGFCSAFIKWSTSPGKYLFSSPLFLSVKFFASVANAAALCQPIATKISGYEGSPVNVKPGPMSVNSSRGSFP